MLDTVRTTAERTGMEILEERHAEGTRPMRTSMTNVRGCPSLRKSL
jgi:hypothetical protein